MARYLYNGTNLDLIQQMTAITASTATLTAAGINSNPFTAPNTTSKVNEYLVFVHSIPSIGNVIVTLQESTVDKQTATMNLADIKLGWNAIQPTTPYQFTTTSANAYRLNAKNSSTNSGGLRIDGSLFSYGIAIDTTIAVSSLAVGDDLWCMGFHNSGLTTYSLTLTGTTLSFGSGTEKSINSTTTQTNGGAIMVGNGGTVKLDDTANCTVQIRGAVFVTSGGLFDKRASSTLSIVSTLIIDCEAANGNYGLYNASAAYGGQILTTGKTVPYSVVYSSGLGTAASPVVTASNHGLSVGDEVTFGAASDYLKNETRFVISIPAANQLVLSNTAGGSENALTQTHAAGSYIGNLSRNSIIKSLTNTRGFWVMNSSSNTTPVCDFSYTRFEYPNIASGLATQLSPQGNLATCDGAVWYNSAAAGRGTVVIQGSGSQTFTGLIMYNQQGTNYSGQSGIQCQISNKNFVDCLAFNAPSAATGTALLSFLSATNCTVTNCHSYGANANNGTLGYAFGFYNSSGITVNNSSAQGGRVQALLFSTAQKITFNNCDFGTIGSNTVDVGIVSTTLNDVFFNNCNFGSATLVSGMSAALRGSLIRFHKYQQDDNRHQWHDVDGVSYSSGAGLDKTVVSTVGSLAVATVPSTSNGTEHVFPFPVRIGEAIVRFGRFWCNATFAAATNTSLVAELYLPGSLTPDQTVTLTKTTDPTNDNALWTLSALNTATVEDVAEIRLVAKNPDAVAGAEAYYDDMDNGTNPITALDTWYEGQPAAFRLMPQSIGDAAANAEAARQAILGDTDTWPTGSKGAAIDTGFRLIKGIFGKK